jgi:hypothetical protein
MESVTFCGSSRGVNGPMLHETTCPMCGEPIDGEGTCTGCGWYEDEQPEPFTDDDLALLHVSVASGAYAA